MNEKLTQLFVESGIRNLWARYADAIWRKDLDAFENCFTKDAIWEISGLKVRGRTDIVKFFAASLEPSEKVLMCAGSTLLDCSNNQVSGRTPVSEWIKRKDGSAKRTLSIYYDRFEEGVDTWRFNWHYFELYYLGAPDLSDPYLDVDEYDIRLPWLIGECNTQE